MLQINAILLYYRQKQTRQTPTTQPKGHLNVSSRRQLVGLAPPVAHSHVVLGKCVARVSILVRLKLNYMKGASVYKFKT